MKTIAKLSALAAAIALTACESENNDQATVTITPTPTTSVSTFSLEQVGRYAENANDFDTSAAEIVAFDEASNRIFVVNAQEAKVDVLNAADVSAPTLISSIDSTIEWAQAGGINSVDVHGGILAVAVEHDTKQENGMVQFYNAADLTFRGQIAVGALPDNVVFTHDGTKVLVANEGEPNKDYSVDPEGSVSIIDVADLDNLSVQHVTFEDFNEEGSRAAELSRGVRITGNFAPSSKIVTAFDATGDAMLTLSDVNEINAGDWVTLASAEGDPIAYRVATVDSDNNTVTFDDEFNEDSAVADSTAAGLTLYLHNGKSSAAQDFEPEYIAVSEDNSTAYVSLQENNAVAVIDIANASIIKIIDLGTKDHSIAGNEMDASDKDDAVNIQSWPVMGYYMPDTIAAFTNNGTKYFVTANEGDSREYDAFVEEVDFKDVGIDADTFTNAAELEEKAALGSLATSIAELDRDADSDKDGKFDKLYSYGARSFTIWNEAGEVVFDSGSDFADITAELYGLDFNNTNSKNDGDSRSDNKGAEPEALAVGMIGDKRLAFIGLERTGGVMVYDITDPANAKFQDYVNNRDFDYPIKAEIDKGEQPAHVAGDLGPEGFKFVPAAKSPNGKDLLIVGSEVSGTTTIYQVNAGE